MKKSEIGKGVHMSDVWYYVQGNERVGPVERSELSQLFNQGVIHAESYVWTKGFDNWKVLNTVEELADLLEPSQNESESETQEGNGQIDEIPSMANDSAQNQEDHDEMAFPERIEPLDLHSISEEEKVFTIKVGVDRGGVEAEYGPFSLVQLRKAYDQKRINEKTYIFTPGMENWVFLGDFDLYEKITGDAPPEIDAAERRKAVRKPFIARMLFHNQSTVFEGICRDISIGGLQVLVSGFPAEVGEQVSMNVHPDNSDHCFTATGVVVRKLEGDTGFSLRFEGLGQEAQTAISSYINGQA